MANVVKPVPEAEPEEQILGMDDILATPDTIYKTIKVPQWKGAIRVGTLNAEELIDWMERNDDPKASKTAGLRLIIISLVDKDGNRIGSVDKHLQAWKGKDASVCSEIVDQIMKLNKLRKTDEEAAKNV